MRVRIHPHLADLAGTGLVLVGFLLAALVLSAVPALVQGLARHGAPPAHSTAPADLSGPGRTLS